jgi:hypothetical protein
VKGYRSSHLLSASLLVACAVALLALQPVLSGNDHRTTSGAVQAQTAPPASSQALMTYSVGGILTADGTLWQFHPDESKWMTIDEAFHEQGRETRILPLPVPASEIADMDTFGFILSKSGEIWLYEFASDAWRKIDSPK